jgi:hypothetical protein
MIHSRVIGWLLAQHKPLRVVKSIQYLSTVSTFKMPKVKCSDSVRLRGFVQEFGEKYFTTDGKILFCKLCAVKVTAEKRFTCNKIVILLNTKAA